MYKLLCLDAHLWLTKDCSAPSYPVDPYHKHVSAYLTLLALYFHYRAENGPCGYKLEPVNSNRTKLLWIINSDLKVSYYVYNSIVYCSHGKCKHMKV